MAEYGDEEPAEVRGADYAAKLSADLVCAGYDDWFLPSKDELNLVYEKLHQEGLGGFASADDYWSSSEVNADHARLQSFGSGTPYGYVKGSERRVRAARAF